MPPRPNAVGEEVEEIMSPKILSATAHRIDPQLLALRDDMACRPCGNQMPKRRPFI